MTDPKTSKARGRYHHGAAKKALLASAENLLEKEGASGLSLRHVAEHARLSRQAPYNHFTDKEALLAELARMGFERLGAAVGAAGDPPNGNALARAAEAYIEFAQTTPALYRLMFSRELVELGRFPEAKAAATAAFGKLAQVVATFTTADRVADLSLAAWSLVHGYAMLSIETGLESRDRRAERAQLFAEIIQAETTNP